VRVAIAVPVGADEGVFDLEAELSAWLCSAGGIGPTMSWMTRLEVVEELPRTSNGSGANRGRHGSGKGGQIAVLWTSLDEEEGWTKPTVGEVEMVEAALLASQRDEYADLAILGAKAIPVIKLNKAYPYLKKYLEKGVLSLTDGGPEAAKGRYAVGVGVALTLLDEGIRKRQDAEGSPNESWILASQQALARGVLSMRPSFDELARETGVED